MIEIIMREDVSNYETKPLFGFSYRQAAAIASAVIIAVGFWYCLTPLGVPVEIVGFLICVFGAAVAAGFLVKIQGMYGTKRLPILLNYYMRPKTVFSQNAMFKTSADKPLTKQELKEKKRALKAVKRESEFCNSDGVCVSAKKRLKLANSGVIEHNHTRITLEDVEDKLREGGCCNG